MVDTYGPQGTAQQPLDPFQAAMGSRDSDVLPLVRTALAEGRAKLAFQPIILASAPDTIAFYEGLIRVLDPAGRVIPAAQFMPNIAMTDLAREVDCTRGRRRWRGFHGRRWCRRWCR